MAVNFNNTSTEISIETHPTPFRGQLPEDLWSKIFNQYLSPTDVILFDECTTENPSWKIEDFKESLKGIYELNPGQFIKYKNLYQKLVGEDTNNATFLKLFINLRELKLTDALLTEEVLISIGKLGKLEYLDLSDCTQIIDISFLENLTRLIGLNLSGCHQIQDGYPIGNLEHLEDLHLSLCTQIRDFSFFENLEILTELYLCYCTQIEDCSFLEDTPDLEVLDLSGCTQLKDFDFLDYLPNLKELDLTDCEEWPDEDLLEEHPTLEIVN